MKCNDCGNLGWGDDEGEIVYGWCRVRQYCPDLGIERDCSSFLKKRPDALSTLQTENEKLRGELKEEAAIRKRQADILCELRSQKYELISSIDQLRAELEQVKTDRDRWKQIAEAQNKREDT